MRGFDRIGCVLEAALVDSNLKPAQAHIRFGWHVGLSPKQTQSATRAQPAVDLLANRMLTVQRSHSAISASTAASVSAEAPSAAISGLQLKSTNSERGEYAAEGKALEALGRIARVTA